MDTHWVVIVGVPSLERVSDLSNVVLLVANGREDALYGRQSKTGDTVRLGILQLGKSTTEQSSGSTRDKTELDQHDPYIIFVGDAPHLVKALVT